MIWSYIYYIPLSRDKHTDFNQCCWLFCIVSTRVPPALTQASAIALVLPCNSFGHRQANWRWFCEKHMYQQSRFEKAERTPDPSDVFLVLVKVNWDSFTCVVLPMISESWERFHEVWVRSSLQQLLCLVGEVVAVTTDYLGSYLVTWKAICLAVVQVKFVFFFAFYVRKHCILKRELKITLFSSSSVT